MTYQGVRHGPSDVVERIEKGEVVDPTSYYFRINPLFDTAAAKYDWINRVVGVGIGHRRADGPIYSVFEVMRVPRAPRLSAGQTLHLRTALSTHAVLSASTAAAPRRSTKEENNALDDPLYCFTVKCSDIETSFAWLTSRY